ncbi:hypothetical protein AB0K48_53095, partial [Nonomuraea sp. NPDC055795]
MQARSPPPGQDKLKVAPEFLLALDGLEQRLEVALSEPFDVASLSYLPTAVGRERLVQANSYLQSWDAG